MTKIQTIEKKISELPPAAVGELELFIDSLLRKMKKGRDSKLKQDWAGALKEFGAKYTSLELQKKALEWRRK